MKYLSRMMCGVALAGLLASCASAPVEFPPANAQTTPADVAREAKALMVRLERLGSVLNSVTDISSSCSCVPPVVPVGPPPPPNWKRENFELAIKLVESIDRSYETGTAITIMPAAR